MHSFEKNVCPTLGAGSQKSTPLKPLRHPSAYSSPSLCSMHPHTNFRIAQPTRVAWCSTYEFLKTGRLQPIRYILGAHFEKLSSLAAQARSVYARQCFHIQKVTKTLKMNIFFVNVFHLLLSTIKKRKFKYKTNFEFLFRSPKWTKLCWPWQWKTKNWVSYIYCSFYI